MNQDELKPLPRNRLLRGAYLMIQRYLRHNVAIQSASLAFYLLFMIFPFLIFISSLLGLLHLNVEAILTGLSTILPKTVVELVEMYLNYVGEKSDVRILLFGLFFSIYFPMRATNTLMRAVRTAYHLGPPKGPFSHMLKTLLYTLLLICAIALTLTLMTVGSVSLEFAVAHLGLPTVAADLWQKFRFPVAALVAYFTLFLLYAMTQDFRQPGRNIYPGVLSSLIGWMVFSYLFSLYVENIAHYSLLYGSIGTVMVVLAWLYMSATTLIMGAELNGTLISMRKDGGEGDLIHLSR